MGHSVFKTTDGEFHMICNGVEFAIIRPEDLVEVISPEVVFEKALEIHMTASHPDQDTEQDQTEPEGDSTDFRTELCSLLNKFSRENQSNTPDYILRDYLMSCLKAFEQATNRRTEWYKEE